MSITCTQVATTIHPVKFSGRSAWLAGKVLHLVLSALVLFTLGSFLGRVGWPVELLSHFHLQYLVGALTLALLCAWLHRWWAALLALACVFLHANTLTRFYSGHNPTEGEKDFRVMLFNVHRTNSDHDRTVAFIRETKPDFLVLIEFTPAWATGMEPLHDEYPHRVLRPSKTNNSVIGIGLYSRNPLSDVDLFKVEGSLFFTIAATSRVKDRPVHLIGSHACVPWRPDQLAQRNREMLALGKLATTRGGAAVVLADLNATPWTPGYADYLRESGLSDSLEGAGLQRSWPTGNPLLRIPIDHCHISDEVIVRKRWLGPDLGSDHFPVIVDCALANVS